MKGVEDRQKSYAGMRWWELEFQVGEQIYRKMSPTKGVIHFGSAGKLKPRFIGPFLILE